MTEKKLKAAQILGSLGGKARAKKLSKEELSRQGRIAGLASAKKRKLDKRRNATLE